MIRTEDAQARAPLTVSELAREIQRSLGPLRTVLVKGEVSGLKQGAKGHYGFTIRDRTSVVEAFLFAGDARRIPTLPEDGQEFIFRGKVDFWANFGRLRLVVDWIEFDDVGRLRAQLEQLKRKLELEGAFEVGRKRPLPFLPNRVALITSPTGAVIHDLQQTIWDRFPDMDIVVYPALVQGTASPGSIVTALRRCNRDGDSDVVVLARGGGSFEELYAFNTEPVARAILASAIPVVTALGHTSDRTIADMVADAECRTPTEAGARVVPKKADLQVQLEGLRRRLERELGTRLETEAQRLVARADRLRQALPAVVQRRHDRLERLRSELARLSPLQQLDARGTRLRELGQRLEVATGRLVRDQAADLSRRQAGDRLERLLADRFGREGQGLAHRAQRLGALSPTGVLQRGYAIAVDEGSGRVLRAAADTQVGARLRVRLGQGALRSTVEEIDP
jgi:exodeoxyribonuclease VII large subunit